MGSSTRLQRMMVTTILCLVGIVSVNAFYLPGVAPFDYVKHELIDVKVNKLDSVKTQLPYDYYSLPFCRPREIVEVGENLGEILAGDMIETSPYEAAMLQEENCKILCKKDYDAGQLQQFSEKIAEEYRVSWIVDNIPAATKYFTDSGTDETPTTHYEKGFALGFVGGHIDAPEGATPGTRYINNHVTLAIFYHADEKASSTEGDHLYRVVGFEVEPSSVAHVIEGTWVEPDVHAPESEYKTILAKNKLTTCDPKRDAGTPLPRSVNFQAVSGDTLKDGKATIVWTYDVQWHESNIKWASRWDLYLKMTDSQIHWFSIINSIMIVLFLTGMVAMILVRTLHRDLTKYNTVDPAAAEENAQEETGWKMIHGEVFRPPAHGGAFSVLIGTGTQVFGMTLVTLIFAVLGFLSPANRGGLMTALLLIFVFMGALAGYFATRVYKMFKLVEWKKNTLITSLFFPGIVFGIFFVLNLMVWGEKSSGAVPFGTLVALLVLWLGISVPLVYLGSYFAFKKPAQEPPVKVNNIPRMLLPEQSWYTHPQFSILVGGVLPFGAVFIEIFFIMSSVWLHQFYYVFGFLFIVFIILIITCAEITIVMCYFQLCNEDYHWWWRSFLTSGSSALYLFLYSILYFFTKLEIIKFVSGVLFFGYMLIVSFTFFLLTGTIGYFACFFFVRKIYSSIKVA